MCRHGALCRLRTRGQARKRASERASEGTSSPRASLEQQENGQVTQLRVRTKLSATSTVYRRLNPSRHSRTRPPPSIQSNASNEDIRLVLSFAPINLSSLLFFSLLFRSLSLSVFFPFFFSCFSLYLGGGGAHARPRTYIVRSLRKEKARPANVTCGCENRPSKSRQTRRNQAEETTTLSLSLSGERRAFEGNERTGKKKKRGVQGPWVLALSKTASD